MRIIDIHTHGGFGINFNDCNLSELEIFANLATDYSIVAFCPTLATDSVTNIKKQLGVFSEFKTLQAAGQIKGAKMLGVHLEAIFLNPNKKGIHNTEHFLHPTIKNFKKVAGDFFDVIKIVTLAPELDKNCELANFLIENKIKVHAGHTLAEHSYNCSATTHHFNAMPPLSHRDPTITLSAINNNEIFTEIIADGIHVCDGMLKLFFDAKNHDKIILVSDSLPIAKSDCKKMEFCGQIIIKSGEYAKNPNGCIAGSNLFIEDIISRLVQNNILNVRSAKKMAFDNPIAHLELDEQTVKQLLKIKIKKK